MLITLKEMKSVLTRPCIVALEHVETCMILIYIWGVHETRGVQGFLTLRGQLLGNGPIVYNKYEDKTICWSGHPVLR